MILILQTRKLRQQVAKVLRVLITGRDKTPDLYDIMRILGQDKVKARLSI